MKVGNFVQLMVDVQDVLSYFQGVQSKDQAVSALEKIKKEDPNGFLESVSALASSYANATEDEIEVPSTEEIDSLLENAGEEAVPANPNPEGAAQRLGLLEDEKTSGA